MIYVCDMPYPLTLLPLKGTYSHDEDHGSHGAARIPDDRIFGAIFACLQHLFYRIKPRRLLFKVILSGHDVPREGEHKIMEYIRMLKARTKPDDEDGLRHCLYVLNADLIMLCLLCHDPNFYLLRESLKVRSSTGKDSLEQHRCIIIPKGLGH